MATVYDPPVDLDGEDDDLPNDERVGQLIDSYRQPAFNLAYRLVRRPEDAADAVQDAFLLAMRAARGSTAAPREAGRFGPWLLKIVANVALAQLRRQRKGAIVSLDALPIDPPDARAQQPLTALVKREQRGDVLQALLALPDAQRAALTLREFQDLSYDEIGELLGLNRGATTALLYRARTTFRAAYEGVTAKRKPLGCTRLAPMISAMLDDELQGSTWKRVDRHVSGCSRCSSELRALRRGQHLHSIVPLLAPPAAWTTATTIGAVGGQRTAEIASLVAKAPAASGLIERAGEAGRPLAAAAFLGATALLPGGAPGSLNALVERGAGKLASLVTAAGLALVVAAGHPGPDASAGQAAVDSSTVADHGTTAGQQAATEKSALWETVDGQPIATTGTATPDGRIVAVGAPASPAVTRAAPATLPSLPLAPDEEATGTVVAAITPPTDTVATRSEDGASSSAEAAATASGSTAPGAGPASGAGTASGPGAPASAGAAGSGTSSGPGEGEVDAGGTGSVGSLPDPPAIDPPAIDLPPLDVPTITVADLPAIDLPAIDVPAIDLPTVDLPAIAEGRVAVEPLDLPAIDVPPVDVKAVTLPVAGLPPIDVPAVDLPAIDVPAIDVPDVQLPVAPVPLVEGTLDQAKAAAGQVTGGVERSAVPALEQLPQVQASIGDADADVARGGSGASVSVSAGGPAGATPVDASVSVNGPTGSGGQPVEASTDIGVSAGASESGQPGSSLVDANVGVDAGASSPGAAESSSSSSGSTSLSVSTNVDAGSNGASSSSDTGSNSSTAVSVSVSADTSSSGSGSADNSSSSDSGNSLSVSVSADAGSSGSGSSDNGGNSDSSNSLSVSVSVDTGSNGSGGSNNSSGDNGSVSVSVGGVSISVP